MFHRHTEACEKQQQNTEIFKFENTHQSQNLTTSHNLQKTQNAKYTS